MSIIVDALRKTFDNHDALDNVSFEVPQGAFFCVVGPSGCGKSTLLRAIAGLETPDTGAILLDDQVMFADRVNVPPEDRQVGVVFQSYALWPHLTVAQNVAFPYEAKGTPRAEALRQAGKHLSTVALDDFADRRPDALSGGQRQRVALARCLAGGARTILMDEPLANLDPHLRHAMEGELRAFHESSGVTTLFITHDQREAMALADIMAVMENGRLMQVGTPQDIYERPANDMVARFVGRGAVLSVKVDAGIAKIAGQEVAVSSSRTGPCHILIRPKQVTLDPGGLEVQITAITYRGGHWEVEAKEQSGGSQLVFDLPQPARVGDRISVRLTGGWALPG